VNDRIASQHLHAIAAQHLTRRALVSRTAAFGLGAVAAGAVLPGELTSTASAASIMRQEPVPGGTLSVGIPVEPAILDAQLVGNTQEIPVASLLYDSLFKYSPDLMLTPHIAEAVEVVDDTTYRFQIRQGVTFHNGREMTADDVRYSLLRAKDPDLEITRRLVEMIDTVEVDDPQTVTVTLTERTPLFLHWLSAIETAIVPQEVIESEGDAFGRNPIGTGPFRFVSWESGSRITLAAFDEYFLGRPYIDEVVYRIVPDLSVVGLELENGTLDLAPFVSAEDFGRLEANPNLEFGTVPQLNYWFFGMNCAENTEVATRIGVFRDPLVRQAFYHGVDWETIALFGLENDAFGYRQRVFYPANVPWHDPTIEEAWPQPQYDPDRARQLLAEAGYADGLSIETVIWNREAERIAIPLQEELAGIGVTLSIQFYELATWLDFVNPGDFDCYIARWTGQDSSDPYAWLYLQFHTSMFGPAGNRARFASEAIDQMLDEAEAEPDPDLRIQKYVAAAKALVPEIPQIPLFGTNAVSVWNPRVRDFQPDALSSWSASVVRLWYPPYAEVWIDPNA